MNRSAWPASLPVAAVAAALLSCAGLKSLVAGAFERPKLTFESAGAEALDLEGVTIALRYQVENPNGIGLEIAKLSYALDVEGGRVASGDLPGGVKLPAHGTAPLVVPVRLRFRDVPRLVESLLSKEEVAYAVSGSAGVDTPVGVVELPFQHSGTAPVPRPPGFALESARFSPPSDVELRVRVTNRNAFAIPAGRLDYALDLSGTEVARGATHVVAALPPGGTAVLALPVRIDLGRAGAALGSALAGKPLDVAVRGTAGYGSTTLPLDLHGKAR